jgi:predicted Zn-dependent protease
MADIIDTKGQIRTDQSSAEPPRPRRPWWRSRLWLLLGALPVLAVVGFFGWRHMEHSAMRNSALKLAEQSRWDRAEPLLREIKDYFPNDVEVARALGRAQSKVRRIMWEREEYLDHWCKVDKDNPEAFRAYLDLQLILRQPAKALPLARRLRELRPNDRVARNMLINLLNATEHFQEAEELCRAELVHHPEDVQLRYWLAKALEGQGRSADMEAVVEDVLKRDPDYPRALLLRGVRLCDKQDYKNAIPILRKVLDNLEDTSTYIEARQRLSEALANTGNKAEAQELLERNKVMHAAVRMVEDCQQQPDDKEAPRHAARAVVKLGREGLGLARRLQKDLLAPDPETRRILTEFINRYHHQAPAKKKRPVFDLEGEGNVP